MALQPYQLTASAAAARLADGSLTAEALARSCLDRIADRDPIIHAWVSLDTEGVIARAKELDKIRVSRGPMGPLHGLPIGVKDMIDTAEFPTTNNSPLHWGNQPAQDAMSVRIAKGNGASILGKTDTVEFAAGGRKALTRNPHDLARTPGGSSSGSGAAVADYQVPLAFGTQTGGSLIRPAGFNGIYALKPTHGAVPWPGARHYSPALDTIGWYGRCPQDLALMAHAFRLRGMGEATVPDIAGLKIGFARTHNWPKAEQGTQLACATAVERLTAAGATVFDIDLPEPCGDMNEMQRIVVLGEGKAQFLPSYLESPTRLHQDFVERVQNKAGITGRMLAMAHDKAALGRIAFDGLFGPDLDVIVTPSTCGEAPVGLESTGDAVMNSMWTLLHVPCLAIPVIKGPNGCPVGIQIVGPRFSDPMLIAMAEAMAPVLDPTLAI